MERFGGLGIGAWVMQYYDARRGQIDCCTFYFFVMPLQ